MKIKSQPIILDIKNTCRDKVTKLISGNKPAVVVIQGMPASGKTTFLNNVSEFMEQNNIPHSVIHSDNYIKDFSALMSQEKTYRIGILDIFKKNCLFVNSKAKPDMPHGEVVKNIITSKVKNVETIGYEIKAKKISDKLIFDSKSVLKQLKKAKKEKLDYLNLSIYFPHAYQINGKYFAPQELHHPEIVSDLKRKFPKSILNIIKKIEEISGNGTEVYISGGNKKHYFNMLSLAKGTHTIGGIDKKTNKPIEYFTNNSLIDTFVELPFEFNNSNVKKFGISLDLAGLSKQELRKRIAKEKDYKLLHDAISDYKIKPDMTTIQYQIPFSVPVSQRNKIYDIKKIAKIYNINLEENFKSTENITHTDISMRQFFNMNSKGERHVISPKKTHYLRYCISGTSFAPPQAIAEDINLNEIARKEMIKNYELYSKLFTKQF